MVCYLPGIPMRCHTYFFMVHRDVAKKTRIDSLLRGLFGPGASRLKLDKKIFTTPRKRTIELNLITSNYHIELSPGDAGLDDRYVIQDVIKEMASSRNLTAASAFSFGVGKKETAAAAAIDTTEGAVVEKRKPDFKVVVLMEVDKLTKQAQAALRRTMERYSTTCRLILCCNNASKVIEPVRSRCLGMRISAPSNEDICQVLHYVAKKEKVTLHEELALNIARESNRNLRKALLMLEACYVQKRGSNLSGRQIELQASDTTVQKTDWEIYITQLASEITREQTPQRLMACREKLYELLVNCIPADVILINLVQNLVINLDDALKFEIFHWAAFYEHRISSSMTGGKEIFHLEAFVAKYMAIYKRYLNELFA